MHENGHNQGAVQYNAPYSTGKGGHCYDELDIMCYSPDGGDLNQGGTIDRCTDRLHFDCGNDTYFDTWPEEGEYLYTNWNMGSPLNRFIALGPTSINPTASFAIECSNLSCSFTDNSTDADGTVISRSWNFGDGVTSSAQNPSHSYATSGTYVVSLTVTDDDGLTGYSSQTLTVPNGGDPDPSTPNLSSGLTHYQTSPRSGQWHYFKIQVPSGRPQLHVVLQVDACTLFWCDPDLDLYVRQGQRPTTSNYSCASNGFSNMEICTITSPGGGFWYIGIHTYLSTPPALGFSTRDYGLTATY